MREGVYVWEFMCACVRVVWYCAYVRVGVCACGSVRVYVWEWECVRMWECVCRSVHV